MTTKVTVDACCADNVEVQIIQSSATREPYITTIQNREKWIGFVQGSIELTILEVQK